MRRFQDAARCRGVAPDSVSRALTEAPCSIRVWAAAPRLEAQATPLLGAVALYGGLVVAPADYQQGDAYRIIFIHVPSAWMSLFIYGAMAVAAFIGLVWRKKDN